MIHDDPPDIDLGCDLRETLPQTPWPMVVLTLAAFLVAVMLGAMTS